MQIIESFEQLIELPVGSMVYQIKDGNVISYYLSGHLPNLKVVTLVAKHSHLTAISVCKGHFNKKIVWTSEYDSAAIGKIRIEQLNHEIEGIKKFYIDPNTP